MRITAFGGHNLPLVRTEVRQVSADRLTDERTGRAFFVTQVVAPQSELTRLTSASGRTLRAGLPANAVAPRRKRTALQYMFEPLNQALWRSLREE